MVEYSSGTMDEGAVSHLQGEHVGRDGGKGAGLMFPSAPAPQLTGGKGLAIYVVYHTRCPQQHHITKLSMAIIDSTFGIHLAELHWLFDLLST